MTATRAMDMPWAARLHALRLLLTPWFILRFRLHGVAWGRRWRVFGMPIIQRHRGSTIALGDGLELRSWRASNPLAPSHPVVLATRRAGAELLIGEGCGLTGATVVAATSVRIGDRVLVGANSTIVDTDFHPLDPAERRRDVNAGRSAPVVIEDDVFIGMQSIILKGVRIGRGAVIGAGSVVSSDVPAGATVSGNPARVVRHAPDAAS